MSLNLLYQREPLQTDAQIDRWINEVRSNPKVSDQAAQPNAHLIGVQHFQQIVNVHLLGNRTRKVHIVSVPLAMNTESYAHPESLMLGLWINTHAGGGVHQYQECMASWHIDQHTYHVVWNPRPHTREPGNPFLRGRLQGNVLFIVETAEGQAINPSEANATQVLCVLDRYETRRRIRAEPPDLSHHRIHSQKQN
ncbi:hypothetical protein V5O48_006029 [Marasmius crinis-equi]|uniref:Uncharacterized protein n=1 Tax=Marasmius crinis-equi TaxID=585013 RepID=A0ABR3FLH4_9AGAR